jgi:hypothetical protein
MKPLLVEAIGARRSAVEILDVRVDEFSVMRFKDGPCCLNAASFKAAK